MLTKELYNQAFDATISKWKTYGKKQKESAGDRLSLLFNAVQHCSPCPLCRIVSRTVDSQNLDRGLIANCRGCPISVFDAPCDEKGSYFQKWKASILTDAELPIINEIIEFMEGLKGFTPGEDDQDD